MSPGMRSTHMAYPKEFDDYTKQEEAGLISAFIQYMDIRFKDSHPIEYHSWKTHVLPVVKEHALTCWGLPSKEESRKISEDRYKRRETKKDNFNSIEDALKFLSERGINVKG